MYWNYDDPVKFGEQLTNFSQTGHKYSETFLLTSVGHKAIVLWE